MRVVKYSDPSTWHEGVSDYEVSTRPRPSLVSMVSGLVASHSALLKRLGLNAPEIYFVRSLSLGHHLAKYIDGTTSNPVFVVDAGAIQRAAKKYDVALDTAFESTLLHEYGHAWLDAKFMSDRPADEGEEDAVEAFAHAYWDTRDIKVSMKILREYAATL